MRLIDDRIAIIGLFGVTLTHWDDNFLCSQAFVMGAFALIALTFIVKDWTVRAIMVYVAIWFIYLLWASTTGRIAGEATEQATLTLQVITVCVIIYTVVRIGRTTTDSWLNAICILAAGLSVVGLLQYYITGVATATFGNQNFLAVALAIGSMCAVRRKWCIILPLTLSCLWVCHTSTAIAAFLVGLGFFIWGWLGLAAAIVPAGAYFFIFKTPESLIERMGFWTDALGKISHSWDKVLFGTGPGIYWQLGNVVHSVYVSIAYNIGLIGIILVGLYCFRSFCNIQDKRLFSIVLVILVDGIGNNLFHTAITCMLAVVMLALNDRDRENQTIKSAIVALMQPRRPVRLGQ